MSSDQVARLILSAVVVFGFGGVSIGWMYAPEHGANRDIIMLIIGALVAGYGQVLGYWFAREKLEGTK